MSASGSLHFNLRKRVWLHYLVWATPQRQIFKVDIFFDIKSFLYSFWWKGHNLIILLQRVLLQFFYFCQFWNISFNIITPPGQREILLVHGCLMFISKFGVNNMIALDCIIHNKSNFAEWINPIINSFDMQCSQVARLKTGSPV